MVTSNNVLFPRALMLTLMIGTKTNMSSLINRQIGVEIWTNALLLGRQEIAVDSSKAANWLERQKLNAYFLCNLEDSIPMLREPCSKATTTYGLVVSNAPPDAEIWLQVERLPGWRH